MSSRIVCVHGLEFGPVSLRVEFTDEELRSDVQSRLALSTRLRSNATWTVTFNRAQSGSLGPDPYAMNIERVGNELRIDSPSVHGILDFEKHRASFDVWRRPEFGSRHFIENILRIVTQYIAIEHGALLVHAAGIADPADGDARVFAGPSGAGKTTISEILRSQGGRVLSDDLVLLSREADRPLVTATPFRGTIEEPPAVFAPSCTLTAIHTLEKSPIPRIGPDQNASRSAALLIANTPFGETWDENTRSRVLDIVAWITNAIPVTPLAFPKDPGFVHVFGSWLAKNRTSA